MAESQSARTCPQCGKTVRIRGNRGGAKYRVYCDTRCRQFHTRGTEHRRRCVCGKWFDVTRQKLHYCSPECGLESRAAKSRERAARQRERKRLARQSHRGWRLNVRKEYRCPPGGKEAVCQCGKRLNELDFVTDHLGRVHQRCRRCG